MGVKGIDTKANSKWRGEPRAGLITNKYCLPYNPELVERAKELRKNLTEAEKILWEGCLRHLKPKFLRQRPIDHFIVDFYCAEANLVIEIDDGLHSTTEGKGRDAERTAILEAYGLRIIRFTNSEVKNKFAWVCDTLQKLLDDKFNDHHTTP